MIGTLLGQEFRSTRKTMLTSLGVVLLVAALATALGALKVPVLGTLGYGLAIIASVLITTLVLALLVENYWRTMYGREGYFTMALPVRGRTLFTAKVLYGLIATFAAAALTALTLLGIAVVISLSNGTPAFALVRDLFATVDTTMVWFVVVTLLIQLGFAVITGAAIISIGAEGRFNHLGFGAPVIGYVILYFVMQVLGLAAMLFVPLSIVMTGPDAGTLVAHGMFDDFIISINNTTGAQPSPALGLGIVPLSIAVAAIFAWWGGRSVERHTSLR